MGVVVVVSGGTQCSSTPQGSPHSSPKINPGKPETRSDKGCVGTIPVHKLLHVNKVTGNGCVGTVCAVQLGQQSGRNQPPADTFNAWEGRPMGNRGAVVFEGTNTGTYLHWHGSPETVRALLTYAREVGVREADPEYLAARFVQIAANTIGGTLSIGLASASVIRGSGDYPDYTVHPDLTFTYDSTGLTYSESRYENDLRDIRAANDPIFNRSSAGV
jgi:hypothetical protein